MGGISPALQGVIPGTSYGRLIPARDGFIPGTNSELIIIKTGRLSNLELRRDILLDYFKNVDKMYYAKLL